MKKFSLIMLTLMGLFASSSLSSCGTAKVTDIDIKEGYDPIVEVGKFDASNYTIIETYSDGTTKEVTVTDDMITDASKVELYSVGEKTIQVKYLGAIVELNLTITRAMFDVTMPSKVVTYDGQAHSLDIEGYYPAGTTITYPNGENFTNVGKYTVQAILSYVNYETYTIESTIEIVSADYDLDVTFKDKTYTFDDETHSLEIEGTLPDEVSVTYMMGESTGNSAKDAGTYTITAVFASKNNNYNPIPSLTATLTINKATYDTESISIGSPDVEYTGELIEWKVVNTLPSWLSVSYENTYVAEEGETVSNTKSYVQKEVGNYKCILHFTVLNTNYETPDDMTFEVGIYEK